MVIMWGRWRWKLRRMNMMVSDRGASKHKIIAQNSYWGGCGTTRLFAMFWFMVNRIAVNKGRLFAEFDSQQTRLPRTGEARVPIRYHAYMVLDLDWSPEIWLLLFSNFFLKNKVLWRRWNKQFVLVWSGVWVLIWSSV